MAVRCYWDKKLPRVKALVLAVNADRTIVETMYGTMTANAGVKV